MMTFLADAGYSWSDVTVIGIVALLVGWFAWVNRNGEE